MTATVNDTASKLPVFSLPQTDLLTVNENEIPLLTDSLAPGVNYKPLFLDPELGVWVVLASFSPGAALPIHLHTGAVHAYTLSGSWSYVEYPDQVQTAGSYLYEPGSSVHTINVPADNEGETVVFFVVFGANVNFNADGTFHSLLDAITIMRLTDQLAEARGLGEIKYIKGGLAAMTKR